MTSSSHGHPHGIGRFWKSKVNHHPKTASVSNCQNFTCMKVSQSPAIPQQRSTTDVVASPLIPTTFRPIHWCRRGANGGRPGHTLEVNTRVHCLSALPTMSCFNTKVLGQAVASMQGRLPENRGMGLEGVGSPGNTASCNRQSEAVLVFKSLDISSGRC